MSHNFETGAVRYLRWSVAGLSPQRLHFDHGSLHLAFVTHKNLRWSVVISWYFLFPCQYHYAHATFLYWGTAVAQWLRCCATNRKVAGSFPDGVIGIFRSHNPSGRTMALGLTEPLTEMSTRSISWG